MRLFHVSEESDIKVFKPRKPSRTDIDQSKGLVWAITEECLPNFLTPRNCPRVCYHSDDFSEYVVAIEKGWLDRLKNTTLYLYEFELKNFMLQDEIAGYYVSSRDETPIRQYILSDLPAELKKRNVKLLVMDNLIEYGEEVRKTQTNWSLCRMRYAKGKSGM